MSELQQANASPMPEGVTDPNYKPAPGRLGNLTVTQQHALDKIKNEIKEEGWFVEARMNDAFLLRFLRARKFNVELAKKMLKECEQWRKDFGVDNIVENFDFKEKAEVNKYYPQFYHKIDKDGQPVWIERLGLLNIKELYAITTPERQLQRLVYEYEKSVNERLPICSKVAGHPVETFCTILDLHNVSLGNFYQVKDFVMKAASVGQDRYPETMGKFYIINSPWAFNAVWRLVKPWLDEVTTKKIDIIGSDYKAKLLAQIPAENLPKEFGGLCDCPGGCSLSDAGPWRTPTTQEPSTATPAVAESS